MNYVSNSRSSNQEQFKFRNRILLEEINLGEIDSFSDEL